MVRPAVSVVCRDGNDVEVDLRTTSSHKQLVDNVLSALVPFLYVSSRYNVASPRASTSVSASTSDGGWEPEIL